MELNSGYRLKVNSEAFAIPILIAVISSIIKVDAVIIGIANALELAFILEHLLSSIFYLFPYFFIFNLFE